MLKTKAAFLMTECKPKPVEFHALGSREVVAHFDGGDITSDAGGLMLREVERRTGIVKKFAGCFTDYRNPEAIEYPVEDLAAQRIYGLCLEYEDLNDHDELRADAFGGDGRKNGSQGKHRRESHDFALKGTELERAQTLSLQNLTMRNYAARRGRIVVDIKEIGSGAFVRKLRQNGSSQQPKSASSSIVSSVQSSLLHQSRSPTSMIPTMNRGWKIPYWAQKSYFASSASGNSCRSSGGLKVISVGHNLVTTPLQVIDKEVPEGGLEPPRY